LSIREKKMSRGIQFNEDQIAEFQEAFFAL